MKITENFTIIPGLAPIDAAAGADSDSVDMGLLHSVLALIALGSITVADFHVKVYSGATAGTKTTALTFNYRYSSAACKSATADVLGAWASSADLTVSNASKDNFLLAIEVDSSEMPSGKNWLTVEISSGATVLLAAVVFVGDARQPNVTVIGA